MDTRDYWLYTIGLALVVAVVALAGCGEPQAQQALPPAVGMFQQ